MDMGPPAAIQFAASFTWLGMVLPISFLEAPLKFRAPGITAALGVGIGRLVFRALNRVEAVFAVVLVLAVLSEWGATSPWTISTLVGLCVVLLVQAALLSWTLSSSASRSCCWWRLRCSCSRASAHERRGWPP